MEDANTVLSTGLHKINDLCVKVTAAYLWDQPEFKHHLVVVAPDPESPSNILNALNDDCLETVFQYLNEINLINAAEVCKRFKKHAEQAFAKKFQDLQIVLPGGFKPSELNCLLKNFGTKIRLLRADAQLSEWEWDCYLFNPDDFLCTVSEHCTAIKNLDLSYFQIKAEMAEKLRPLFTKLESLRLQGCDLKDSAESLISVCLDLKMLNLSQCNIGNGKCIKQKFKKLEEVHLNSISADPNAIINFFKLNPTMKKLSVQKTRVGQFRLVQAVNASLPNLKELTMYEWTDDSDDFVNDFPVLDQLTSLKILRLNFHAVQMKILMENFAANNIPIEDLTIFCCQSTIAVIDSISELTKIKRLTLKYINGNFTDGSFIQLVKALPELQELYLHGIQFGLTTNGIKKILLHATKLTYLHLMTHSIVINLDDYNTIIKMVQSRLEKGKLRIWLECDGNKVNVPRDILEENRDIFHINMIYSDWD